MRKKSFLLFVILCCITILVACALVACNPSSNQGEQGQNDGNDGGPDDGGEIYYTVTFDSQGGSMVQSVRVKSGDKLTAPANPTRTSYNFSGWYKDSAYTKIWDFSVEQVTQDITLYARWIAEDGKIIAVENAKIDGLDIFMVVRNDVTDVRLANAVTIGGNAVWKLYLDKLGTQEIPTKIAASTNGILREGDNVFYIVSTSSDGQQVRTYTLTIHRSYYATVSVYDPYGKLYNTYIRETYFESFTPPAAFTGYTITSWNVSDDRWQNDGLIRQNTQFKPICQANRYTVNLNAQGGQCSSTSATLTYDSSYKLPVPTKTGYVFMGWSAYTSGGSFVTDDCGYSKANWKNAQSGGTLYAIWALGSYEVTARANDETAGVVVGGGTYKYGSSVTLSATTNAGYTFVGWYEGEEKLSDDLTYTFTMPAANVTYTAVWQLRAGMEVFNFSSTPTDITILGVNDSDISAITIPSYSGVSIQIAEKAFSGCKNLTSVTIGSGVTSIGSDAFRGCYKLIEVYNKSKLNIVAGSSGNGYVAYYAKNVYAEEGGSRLAVDSSGFAFYYDGTTGYLVGYAGDKTEIVLPDGFIAYNGVRVNAYEINNSAFRDCINLTSITIPDSVTSIGDYAFSNCTGLTSITIPDSVINIGKHAFSGCTGLTRINWDAVSVSDFSSHNYVFCNAGMAGSGITVTFGDSVETIPAYLFDVNDSSSRPNIKSVTIGNSVTSIGYRAFYGCIGLTSVTIGNGVTNIGDYTFYNCSGLKSVTMGDSVISIGDYAFAYCSGLKSVTIPDSVTSIEESAFYGCSGLVSVTIGDSVKSIGSWAFESCSGLTSVYYTGDVAGWCGISGLGSIMSSGRTLYINGNKVEGAIAIPDGVQSVPSYAFYCQTDITSITIPDSVTSIGSDAFAGCSGLTEINWNAASVNDFESGSDLFRDAGTAGSGITVTFGDSVEKIPAYLFYSYRPNIKSVTIGDSVTSIGDYAFSGCSGLTSITIPDSVTSIGSSAFSGCRSLEAITIPFVGAEAGKTSSDTYLYPFGYIFGTSSYTGGTAVGQYYHGSSTSSTYSTYYIPSSLRSVTVTGGNILYGAFYNCSMLTSVTVGNGVTSIGDRAFYNCSGLTSITIPDSVTSIGFAAFEDCSSLTSITIPDSVTSIGDHAFDGCSSLTSITIPDSVTSIGFAAFQSCSSLTSVIIPDSVTSIGQSAFRNCIGLTSVTFENTSGWRVSEYSSFSSYTSLSSSDLSNRSTAATYLKSTYEGYYWRRV